MSRFASGKDSYAISDRSGFRYKYRDMRKEWNGLLVGKDEFEAKQPQLGPFRKVFDAQALKDARPPEPETFTVLVGNPPLEDPNMAFVKASAQVGQVIVDLPTITPSTATPTGLSATASVGTVTVSYGVSTSVTGLAATSAVGSVTVNYGFSVDVTGVSGTSQVGTATTIIEGEGVSVSVTGLSATGVVNSVLVWSQIVPTPGTSWSTISPSQTPDWEEIAA